MSSLPLTPPLLRALQDKLYEKRKQAALELERSTHDLITEGDWPKIQRILDYLITQLVYTQHTNSKNGGVMGIAAVAIALGDVSKVFNEYHAKIPMKTI
jgi:vacuole morphology and inheritance protein 14